MSILLHVMSCQMKRTTPKMFFNLIICVSRDSFSFLRTKILYYSFWNFEKLSHHLSAKFEPLTVQPIPLVPVTRFSA
jgi:hypothetical protein